MKLIRILILFVLFLTACSKEDNSSKIENSSGDNDQNEVVDNEGEQDNVENEETPPTNSPPGNFNLLAFENQMKNVELMNLEFSWEEAIDPDGDPVTYDLMFETGNIEAATKIAENLTETSFLLETTLSRNTLYSWQVIASDTEDATTESQVHSFTTRPIIIRELVSEADFEGRTEHVVLVYDNKIWLIGGVDTFERSDEVWYSQNGIDWIKITNNAEFTSRGEHSGVVFNNKMWVVGGIDNLGNPLNDVWSSSDGLNWTLENAAAPFSGRYNHTLAVYNNKLWLIGGQNRTFEFNDVWSSEDGANWTLETDDPGFPSRHSHTTIVFDNKMFVIAGLNANQGSGFGALNDIWSSSDGVNWQIETIDAEFSPRYSHSTVLIGEEIWVIGGLANHRRNDIWSSKDGINWVQEAPNAKQDIFSSRFNHSATVMGRQIFVIGGNDGSRENDIWTLQQ